MMYDDLANIWTCVDIHDSGCWLVPFDRNTHFVGHEDRLRMMLDKKLFNSDTDTMAITGLGGVGKTTLALELAYRARENYPRSKIFWVSASSMEEFERGYLRIGLHLRLPDLMSAAEYVDVKLVVKEYLSQESAGQWMLIVDGADDMDIVFGGSSGGGPAPFRRMADYLPNSANGLVLVTTRDRRVGTRLGQQNVESLGNDIDEESALSLLTNSLIHPKFVTAQPDVASNLLKELAHLPLAIVQAARYINENGLYLSEYLALLQSSSSNMVKIHGGGETYHATRLLQDYHEHSRLSIKTTWIPLFEKLYRQHPVAAEYLSFMASLDPSYPIPHALLPDTPSVHAAAEAINILSAYSLVTKTEVVIRRPSGDNLPDPDFACSKTMSFLADRIRKRAGRLRGEPSSAHRQPTYTIHKLVHMAARSWLRKEHSSELQHSTEVLTTKLAGIFNGVSTTSSSNPERLQSVKPYLPHALCILRSNLDSGSPPNDTDTDLRHMVGACLLAEGRYSEAEQLLVTVVNRRKKACRHWGRPALTAMSDLASAYRALGRWYEAQNLGHKVVSRYKRFLGEHDPATLSSTMELCWTWRKQGKWVEAVEVLGQTLRTQTAILPGGRENLDTLRTINHLARTYREMGKWKEALALAEEAYQARRRLLLPYYTIAADDSDKEQQLHPEVLDSLSLLASVYRSLGRFQEAETLGMRVLDSQRNTLDGNEEHPDYLDSMANLSRTYRVQGRFRESEDLALRVLDARRRLLGEEHPQTLAIKNQLAWIYRKQNRLSEAEVLDAQVRDADVKTLGEEHPLTLNALYGLSRTYTEQKRWVEAERLGRRVLDVQWRTLGPDHPLTLANLGNIATVFRGRGMLDRARNAGEYVLQAERRVFGEDHPWTLDMMEGLARTYLEMGEYGRAAELGRECLEKRRMLASGVGGGRDSEDPAVRRVERFLEELAQS